VLNSDVSLFIYTKCSLIAEVIFLKSSMVDSIIVIKIKVMGKTGELQLLLTFIRARVSSPLSKHYKYAII
jgi:hypothetical protein